MRWAFAPLIAGKPWNGSTIHTSALGGSESAVAYLALHMANVGEDVTVFTHGVDGEYQFDGVRYVNVSGIGKVINDETFDVVVSSRWHEITEAPWRTRMLLFWAHDLNDGTNRTIRANRVVLLSKFQASSWMFPEDRVTLIGDGVDGTVFNNKIAYERDENALIWTSNMDRGLTIAARIMQEVRRRWPDYVLHVYGGPSVYGWDESFGRVFQPRECDRNGVVLHGPVPRNALASILKTSFAMFYPTTWPETFCMATMEAQACGTPVIASPLGALNETVRGGVLSYDFLNAISQLRNPNRWRKLSATGEAWGSINTWDIVARKWIAMVDAEVRNV